LPGFQIIDVKRADDLFYVNHVARINRSSRCSCCLRIRRSMNLADVRLRVGVVCSALDGLSLRLLGLSPSATRLSTPAAMGASLVPGSGHLSSVNRSDRRASVVGPERQADVPGPDDRAEKQEAERCERENQNNPCGCQSPILMSPALSG
jgi:hypothetical protein